MEQVMQCRKEDVETIISSPLRIGLVLGSLTPGGVECVNLRLADHFEAKGHKVEIVLVDEPGIWFEEIRKQFPVHCLDVKKSFSRWTHVKRIGAFLNERRFDAILLNHVPLAQTALAYLDGAAVVIPVVHADREEVHRVAKGNREKWDVAIGVSKTITRNFGRHVESQRVYCIQNGVDIPSKEIASNRSGLTGMCRLIYLGRLAHVDKGVFYLPEILNLCLERGVDCRLTIGGFGTDGEELESRFRRNGTINRVQFVGPLQPEEAYTQLLSHHILLMPSHSEGFPVASLEAQACGCVPIASCLKGATDEGIRHEESGYLVEMGNSDEFAECVSRLANNPALWERMSQAARRWVRKRFSASKMADQYLSVIRKELELSRYGNKKCDSSKRVDTSLLSWKDHLPQTLRNRLSTLKKLIWN
jgi:glycosyltransferase involved in cell wall biosynthesis